MTNTTRGRTVLMLAALGLLAACATTPGDQLAAKADPWEKTNRSIYKFNRGIDKAVVSPATNVYRAVVPQAAQHGVANAFGNATQPLSFVNALLQGKISQAFRSVDRFLINTTLGLGGLADHATDMGRPDEPEDFGQTLAVWGVKSGPYVMLPIFGPSTIRDAIGFAGEQFADPYQVALAANVNGLPYYGVRGLSLLNTRSYLMDTTDGVLKGSADEYTTVKSAYLQYRENLIYDGDVPEEEEAPLLPATPSQPASAAEPVEPPASTQPKG